MTYTIFLITFLSDNPFYTWTLIAEKQLSEKPETQAKIPQDRWEENRTTETDHRFPWSKPDEFSRIERGSISKPLGAVQKYEPRGYSFIIDLLTVAEKRGSSSGWPQLIVNT